MQEAKRMGQGVGLLSLPDELLSEIALETCKCDDMQFRGWAKTASTCKRLYELQVASDCTVAVIRKCKSEARTPYYLDTLYLHENELLVANHRQSLTHLFEARFQPCPAYAVLCGLTSSCGCTTHYELP